MKSESDFDFEVISKNFKLTYHYDSNIAKLFPKWDEVIKQKNHSLIIHDVDDFKGIYDFFDGILNHQLTITNQNRNTIQILTKQSGFQLSDNHYEYISKKMNIKDILENYISDIEIVKEKKTTSKNLTEIEDIISERYEEILETQYYDLLIQIDINHHHNILSKALKNPNQQFPYSKFIDFIIHSLTRTNFTDIQTLFSQFTMNNFSIEDLKKLSEVEGFDDRYFYHYPKEIINLYLKNHDIEKENNELRQLHEKIDSLQNKINEISKQASNIKSIENTINSNQIQINEIKQIDSNLINKITEVSKENQKNIIDYIDTVHDKILFTPKPNVDGIINYLQKTQNINDEIEITSSSIYRNNVNEYDPYNLIKYDPEKKYISENLPNSWICFQFKNYQVILTSYAIRSRHQWDGNHLINWIIQISNDYSNWEEIDRQENCEYLNGLAKFHTFDIARIKQKEAKFIRLVQIGKNSRGNDICSLNSIEFYGYLRK